MLCLNGNRMLFFVNQLSIRHHNKSYNYEHNTKYRQNSEPYQKTVRRKCQSHLIHKLFYVKFIQDSINVFFKPMGTINVIVK